MMSDQQSPRAGLPPMGADETATQRTSFGGEAPMQKPMRRAPAVDLSSIFVPPEPHEKYHIPEEMLDPDMDYFWLPTRIYGEPNSKVPQYYRAGWMPAKSADFPKLSGFGVEFPQVMIDMGLLANVAADAPMIVDDMMLVQRHKQLSARARQQDAERAKELVNNQMRRLDQAYRQADPRQPGVSRRVAPMPDAPFYEE